MTTMTPEERADKLRSYIAQIAQVVEENETDDGTLQAVERVVRELAEARKQLTVLKKYAATLCSQYRNGFPGRPAPFIIEDTVSDVEEAIADATQAISFYDRVARAKGIYEAATSYRNSAEENCEAVATWLYNFGVKVECGNDNG